MAKTTVTAEEVGAMEGAVAGARTRLCLEKEKKARVHLIVPT
jgi:hypothetical protein